MSELSSCICNFNRRNSGVVARNVVFFFRLQNRASIEAVAVFLLEIDDIEFHGGDRTAIWLYFVNLSVKCDQLSRGDAFFFSGLPIESVLENRLARVTVVVEAVLLN